MTKYITAAEAAELTGLTRMRIFQLGVTGQVRRKSDERHLRWRYNVADLKHHVATVKIGRPPTKRE